MKLQLLPSTFDENGSASDGQHLTCFIINDRLALDAGSLAFAATDDQRTRIRDIVLTHAHLDHIAGLPIFLDDLFAVLREPVRVYAAPSVIDVLERDIFNWSVYPRFSELSNEFGSIVQYFPIEDETTVRAAELDISPIGVNHKVPSSGFLISDETSRIAFTGDTAETERFWEIVNGIGDLSALLIECAFPDELSELAEVSHHLTPRSLERELAKFTQAECPIFVVNMKPMYRRKIAEQLASLGIPQLDTLNVGKVYRF